MVATLVPKPNFKPRTDAGQFLKKFKATRRVSESEYQLVRLDAQAMDDVTFGWGIVGRIHEGARAVFERTKVNDEVAALAHDVYRHRTCAFVPHVRSEFGDHVLGLQRSSRSRPTRRSRVVRRHEPARERLSDGVYVVDAAAPGAAACLL